MRRAGMPFQATPGAGGITTAAPGSCSRTVTPVGAHQGLRRARPGCDRGIVTPSNATPGGRHEHRRIHPPVHDRGPGARDRRLQARGRGRCPSPTSTGPRRSTRNLGWREDADFPIRDDFRVIQMTPPGSQALRHLRQGRRAAARTGPEPRARRLRHRGGPRRPDRPRRRRLRGLPRQRVRRGRRAAPPGWTPPATRTPPGSPSATRTATAGCCRRSQTRLPGR